MVRYSKCMLYILCKYCMCVCTFYSALIVMRTVHTRVYPMLLATPIVTTNVSTVTGYLCENFDHGSALGTCSGYVKYKEWANM